MNNRMMDIHESDTNHFPTPAEVAAKRRANASAEVAAILTKIRAMLEKDGPGVLSIESPSQAAREEVSRILREKGWAASFGSDQRDGSWVSVEVSR
jgi:hypothetical protein